MSKNSHAATTIAMLNEADREGIDVDPERRQEAEAERLRELTDDAFAYADEFDEFAQETEYDSLECRLRCLERETRRFAREVRALADALEDVDGQVTEGDLAERLHPQVTGPMQGG